jgi:hypothetical protein
MAFDACGKHERRRETPAAGVESLTAQRRRLEWLAVEMTEGSIIRVETGTMTANLPHGGSAKVTNRSGGKRDPTDRARPSAWTALLASGGAGPLARQCFGRLCDRLITDRSQLADS